MPVTDDQVATLRALLRGQVEEHRSLLDRLDREEANVGYAGLLAAGFFEAVERRFIVDDKMTNRIRIIEFVASVRARTDELSNLINPDIAERMILHALDQGESIFGIDKGSCTGR